MLYQIVYMPGIYKSIPPHANLYYEALLSILRDSLCNCLLLVDKDGQMEKALHDAVRLWPQQHRMRAQELLLKMKRQNRFISVSSESYQSLTFCTESACLPADFIARTYPVDLTLCVGGCKDCNILTHAVALDQYQVSKFSAMKVSRDQGIRLYNGEWDKATFAEKIWEPVFKYAKHVKLIDRYIGRSMRPGATRLAHDYERSLRWIFEHFVALSRSKPVSSFEVYCGISSDDYSTHQQEEIAKQLRMWARQCSEDFGYEIKICVKREYPHTNEMEHDRFLLTDQVALAVGRGFALLRQDGFVRDVGIHYEGQRGKIEAMKALPDIV